MKRFSKMLALGMTLAMVFGMSVNASYASSENPSPKPWQVPGTVEKAAEFPEGWTMETLTEEAYNNAKAAAESTDAKAQIEAAKSGWTFDAVMDVWNFGWYEREDEDGKKLNPEDGIVKVKMPALPDNDNYTYVLLHFPTSDWTDIKGYPEVIDFKLVDWENNYWAFKVAGGSPIIFVRLIKTSVANPTTTTTTGAATAPTANATGDAATPGATTGAAVSPKTGEAMPVATMMVLVCLAGVAVCAKKARSNG